MTIELTGTVKPLGNRVLVVIPEVKDLTKNGIIIPGHTQERPQEGEVVAVGEGTRNVDGTLTPLSVVVGSRILFNRFGGVELTIEGKVHLLMSQDEILAVLS
jgi:chaperonin GroES